jgi:hypothetical protein
MRRGGFGALLAFTVAIVMFNGQGGSSTGSVAGSGKSAALSAAAKSVLSSPGKGEDGASLGRGVCKLQPDKISSDHPCGQCNGFCPADDLQGTISEFFLRSEMPPFPPCQSSPPNRNPVETPRELQNHWNVPYEFRRKIRFVIATAPDPLHTHLTLAFDRGIAAVIEGAQREGYLFARSTMPWDTAQHPESSTLSTRLTAADWQSQKETLPGLMIFRRALPKDPCDAAKVLFVFVVGERPTGGINKQQFLYALRIMASIRAGAKENTTDSPLLILGPTFSGSLYSLHYLLDEGSDTRPVIIHSGTASSYATIRWFQSRCRKRVVVFRSFQESDEYALQHFLAFAVEKQRYDKNKIAVLSEDETAYGDQPNEAAQPNAVNPCPAFPASSYPSEITHLYFPRDISHLRSAYQQQIQAAVASNSGSSPSPSTLPLNLADTGTDDDSVPIYSPGQTPLSEEAILQGIVSNLQQHHSVFVVLQATNPLDTLFLSRYLRRAYPEGRIVTIGEDSLLSREVDDPRFRGILALTSYSLLPGIDDQMPRINATTLGATHTDLVFPWNFSVGAFNAMVALLHEPPPSPDCNPPVDKCTDLPAAAYAEYGWPDMGGEDPAYGVLAPPLWLTVIGSNGYWPLALLDGSHDLQPGQNPLSQIHAVDDSCSIYCRNPSPPHVPHSWRMLCVVFLAVVIPYLFLRYYGSILVNSKIVANFAPVKDSYCNYGLLIADIMFFAIAFLLLAPWRYVPFHFPDWPLHYSLWGMLIFLAIFSFCDFLKRGSYWLPSISLLIVVVFWGISSAISRPDPSSFRNLSFYRYVHITSGVSPLVPFLILALAGVWWAWYTLAGLVLTDKRGPQLPRAENFAEQNAPGDHSIAAPVRFYSLMFEKNRGLLRVARPASMKHPLVWLPLLAVPLSLFVIDFSHPVHSLEGQRYDLFYSFAFTVVLLVLLCDLFRLVAVWIELRPLLSALDRLTLRRGFLRLKELREKPIWRLGGSAFDDFSALLTREIEALQNLSRFLKKEEEGEDKDPLSSAIDSVEKAAGEPMKTFTELSHDKEGKDNVSSWRRLLSLRKNPTAILLPKLYEFHVELATACAKALLFLLPRWSAETIVPTTLPESPEPVTEFRFQKTSPPQSTQIAEDFVCLFYYNFISSIFLRLRTLLMSVAGMLCFSFFPSIATPSSLEPPARP